MNNREFFIRRWEAEQPAFAKVLRAVPENQLEYRPHERSARAGALAWQLAVEQQQLSQIIEKGEVQFAIPETPKDIQTIIKAWDDATHLLGERLKSANDDTWARKASFVMNGQVVWSDTTENMFWGYLFDMVHHRGQLSAYLRPMGGKVPSIYGPSADDAGG